MTDENFDNFEQFFNGLQKQLKELRHKRSQLNKKIKNYINNFQTIESEIYKSLFDAREFYHKRRNFCNKKIRKLTKEKIEYKQFLESLIEKKKTVQKPKINSNTSNLINSIKKSIKQIEYKIDNLNKIIKTQILDISEENNIVEKISKLEKKKEKRSELLSKLEQEQITEQQNSDYYEIHNEIEIFQADLKEIDKKINKWSNNRLNTHKKMLDLCRKTKQFENFKNKMQKELIENKTEADQYYSDFLKLMGQNEKILRDRKRYKSQGKQQERQIQTPRLNYIIKKKRFYRKYMKEKLAIALEKQKSGKKLDIIEFRLILEHSRKKV